MCIFYIQKTNLAIYYCTVAYFFQTYKTYTDFTFSYFSIRDECAQSSYYLFLSIVIRLIFMIYFYDFIFGHFTCTHLNSLLFRF